MHHITATYFRSPHLRNQTPVQSLRSELWIGVPELSSGTLVYGPLTAIATQVPEPSTADSNSRPRPPFQAPFQAPEPSPGTQFTALVEGPVHHITLRYCDPSSGALNHGFELPSETTVSSPGTQSRNPVPEPSFTALQGPPPWVPGLRVFQSPSPQDLEVLKSQKLHWLIAVYGRNLEVYFRLTL